MDADQDIVAEAVKDAMNGHGFSEAFTAQCKFRPRRDRDDLTGLQVTVIGGERRREIMRGLSRRDLGVEVLIQSPCDPESLSAVRALNGFVQELDDWLEGQSMGGATYVSSELTNDGDPLDPALMIQHGQFEAVLRLTYRYHANV